jgi:serine/threonine-protein kinase
LTALARPLIIVGSLELASSKAVLAVGQPMDPTQEGGSRPIPSDQTSGLDPGVSRQRPLAQGASFGRYRDLRFLGSGGMATVYRAYDPTLDRPVALKLIRGEEPHLAERLLVEARAQARIEHEHVCRIYEVGEEGGRPYIVMQFVEGGTLKDVQHELSLEQKLKVMKEVAEGVHAAHRVGFIHRDLKPTNVMVERTPEGGYHPYVMDFGLAREAAAPGLTATGMVMGTPWYMSPEQARGDSGALDRRSDVYSLGATLYELLAGRPPFDSDSSLDVLVKLLNEEPVPVGSHHPQLPSDVQTIVMKCLEKDPGRRYDSARALADDLGRYLEGEPIRARASGFLGRLAKKARKNKALVATGGVATLAVLAAGGYALRTRAVAREQGALATEFGQVVGDAFWLMRVAHLAPLHDVRAEKAQVRERLLRIEQRMQAAGALARGPGEHALGRGQLVLGDADQALVHLERAWQSGYRTPDVAYSLGLTLSEIYRREREAADGIGSRELREARRQEIQDKYRDPATSYLRQSAGSQLAVPEYAEGLLAFCVKRSDQALAKADEALARAPWLYEAGLLKADVHSALSREKHETGDSAGSVQAVAAAVAEYEDVAGYARSEPAAREGLCQTGIQRMERKLYQGADLDALYAEACRVCEEALAADPERAAVHAKLANIHRFWANQLSLRGEPPFAALDRSAQSARRALEIDPGNRRAIGNLGVGYRLRAAWESGHGLDAKPSLDQALLWLTKASALAPNDPGPRNDLGNAFVTRALMSVEAGGDPRADLEAAVAHYDAALEQVPDFGYAHANRGLALRELAEYDKDHGLSPDAHLRDAEATLRRAVELMPDLDGTHSRLAEAYATRAAHQLAVGQDPQPALARAQEQLDESLRINAKPGPEVWMLRGRVALIEAELRLGRGQSPMAALDVARVCFGKAAVADPRLGQPHRLAGAAATLEARWRAKAGQDPVPAFARARSALEKAVAVSPKDAGGFAAWAERCRWAADWRRSRGQAADAEIAEGLERAERALTLVPSRADAMAARGALQRLQAEAIANPALRRAAAQGARESLRRALELNAHLRRAWEAEMRRADALSD